jgi:hypothetical protein
VIWPGPPGRWFAHTRLGVVPTVCHSDRQRYVSTTPAAAPMLRTGRSTRDTCSRCPVCHPITLSVCGRSRLSSSQDNRRTLPTLLYSHRAPFLPHHRTPLLQASKCRPPRTALVRHCATPSWPLSHYPPQAIIEPPSQPPPSIAEATLPSSATDVHLHHRSDLRLSSPPLHEPRAGALHLFSGLPSPVPHCRLASPP